MGHLSHIKENGSIASKKTTTDKTNGRTEFIVAKNSRKCWQFYAFIISFKIIWHSNEFCQAVKWYANWCAQKPFSINTQIPHHKSTSFNQFVARCRLEHVHQYTWCKFFFFFFASHISFLLNSRQTLDLKKIPLNLKSDIKQIAYCSSRKKMVFLEKNLEKKQTFFLIPYRVTVSRTRKWKWKHANVFLKRRLFFSFNPVLVSVLVH